MHTNPESEITARSSRKLRSAVGAVLMVSGVLFGTVGLAEPASAAATMCGRSGCEMFQNGPNSGHFFSAPGYTRVTMKCWKDASWFAGTNRWFKVTSIYGTGTQWVSANQVINQTRVGRC